MTPMAIFSSLDGSSYRDWMQTLASFMPAHFSYRRHLSDDARYRLFG